jgi:predicted DNA-binding WGR domain protein
MDGFDAMHLAPTLFGQWAHMCEWGRIGSPGQVREQLFETESAARTTLIKKVRIKARRGYVLASGERA